MQFYGVNNNYFLKRSDWKSVLYFAGAAAEAALHSSLWSGRRELHFKACSG